MFGLPHIWGIENKIWQDNYAVMIVGRKRTGKSTMMAMIAQEAIKAGYPVYSNYPIDGTIRLPKVEIKGKMVLDKEFLYDNVLLKDAYVLLDEVGNIWNNRSWGKWTDDDSDFFNFLGKNNTRVILAVQYYSRVDLNVRMNADAIWYVRRSIWPHTSIVECDIQDLIKVEDTQSRVLDSKYLKVNYDLCVIPDGTYYFRRKRWYPYFLTLYKDDRRQTDWSLQYWHDLCFAADSPPDLPIGGQGGGGDGS